MIRGIASIANDGDAGAGERLVRLGGGQRREVADQHLPVAQAPDLIRARKRDLGDDVGAPGVADLGTRLAVLGVGVAGALAGAGLDDDVDPVAFERGGDGWNQRDSQLAGGCFFRYPIFIRKVRWDEPSR